MRTLALAIGLFLASAAHAATPLQLDAKSAGACWKHAPSRTILDPGGYVGWRLDCLYVRVAPSGFIFCQEELFEGSRVAMNRIASCGPWLAAAQAYLSASWR